MTKHVFAMSPMLIICFAMSSMAQQSLVGNAAHGKRILNQGVTRNYNEVEQAASVDLVVLGSVIHMVPLPGPRTEMFHSEVIVHIDSVLKGSPSFRTVIVKQQSGPLTGDTSIYSSIEPRFNPGERVVLFLTRPARDSYLNSPFVKWRYKTLAGSALPGNLPDSVFWVDNKSKFDVKGGEVFYFGKPHSEAQFIRNIRKLK